MKHKFLFLIILSCCSCRRENYAGFQSLEVVYSKQKNVDVKSISKIQRIESAEKPLGNLNFSTIHFESKSDSQIVKNDTLIDKVETNIKKSFKLFNEHNVAPKKNVNYEKRAKISGVLGISSIVLLALIKYGGGFLAVISPILSLLLGFTIIFGFSLGKNSVKKVPKNKKVMPIIGIIVGSAGILAAIIVFTYIIIIAFRFYW